MKEVVVHPERCVGCMQCMIACATAHSKAKSLFAATLESPLPKPRVHVGVGQYDEGFPNRCRHCDPAPCLLACLPGAISRDLSTNTVLIDPDRCINCATCAMVCPFGVLRYHEEGSAPPGKTVAVKCDNCIGRQEAGLAPACVEVCKSGALTFEELSEAMRRKTNEISRTVSVAAEPQDLSPGFSLLNTMKKSLIQVRTG
ncbi:CO dehydrogenase iron-sulfur protein CooF (EC [Olavius algarvensis associated proteobacterium Delta 3]|nr:CO dehydrogenase iron-sulfur protein CooF (EC [Olavius algarvensis associated proteobacterium Delta 3]CAB5169308.1 CO dehydrogenase iron-sulfur protein CooF (EC [Olavius algarvensis associated proteobacterium Delta 3]